jgi:hypothetical protein
VPYFPDDFVDTNIRRVGWLDKKFPFTTGQVSATFFLKLKELSRDRKNQTRGYHICQFCPDRISGMPFDLNGEIKLLGSAEIHVPSSDGRMFEVPNLICHYIAAHEYCPPEDFISAVLSSR